jgi:hypothetical protein
LTPLVTADTALANLLGSGGYKTVSCGPITATLGDLRPPLADTWLSKLDFGGARWLFVLAVEGVEVSYARSAPGSTGARAVLSGLLFEKQAGGGRLVWRDRVIGTLASGMPPGMVGRKKKVELAEGYYVIADGIVRLLATVEFKDSKKRYVPGDFVTADAFDLTCSQLWPMLVDALKNPKNYRLYDEDDVDMMAVYSSWTRITFPFLDSADFFIAYVVLKANERGCSMRIVETQPIVTDNRRAARNLVKRVRASLP